MQLKSIKPYKAPGPDGIPNIVLSSCADEIVDRLFYIYEAMLERGLLYKPWKASTTVVLRKPGKPHYDVPKAYRPIALLNTMWKVLTAIIANHISFITEEHQLLPTNHFGGRPGRTTTDALHLLTYKIKQAWRSGKIAAVLFLDIEGAFPNAVPARLLRNLRKRGVPSKYVNFVSGMLRGRSTTLKFDGHTSDPIKIDNGIGQGDPLSMVLYQFYNADLLDIPRDKSEDALAYVDDTILVATAESFHEAHSKLESMMSREGGVSEWSKMHNSSLEFLKLALIDFAHRSSPKAKATLQLPQRQIEPSTSAKYLGVILDQNLTWKTHQAYAVEKGTKWAAQIRRIARPAWGITPKYARRLYISVALPRILYAADVWCVSTQGKGIRARAGTLGPAKAIKQIASIQRAGALAITGGLRTTATDALNAHAHLLPAALIVRKWCHLAMTRMATLPEGHPLYKPVKRKRTGRTKRHKGPIHYLARWFETDVNKVEKIPAAARHPSETGKLPFKLSIAENREDSIRETETATEEIQIFSDGSALENKVGASAVLIRKGRHTRTLHFHLGPDTEHTVHEAELVGIILGLHLLGTEKKKGRAQAMVGMDNQAAIKAFDSEFRNPGHHLAREALRAATHLKKKSKKSEHKLTIRWTAGHEGLEGNELADREAKEAAKGKASDTKQLPPYLRKPLLINPAALKAAHNAKLKKEWQEDWKKSERGQAAALIDETTPSSRFLKLISNPKLSREAASKISQLRLKHFPLNGYLKRIRRVDSARCPACGEDTESIEHFLLRCPSYAHERWTLAHHARKKHKPLTIKTLVGDPEFILKVTLTLNPPPRSYCHTVSQGLFESPLGWF